MSGKNNNLVVPFEGLQGSSMAQSDLQVDTAVEDEVDFHGRWNYTVHDEEGKGPSTLAKHRTNASSNKSMHSPSIVTHNQSHIALSSAQGGNPAFEAPRGSGRNSTATTASGHWNLLRNSIKLNKLPDLTSQVSGISERSSRTRRGSLYALVRMIMRQEPK